MFVIVGYPSDVRAVILDPHTGVLSRMKVGGVVVDMTTSEPSLAKEIYAVAKTKGVSALDAPVSGGDVGARQATLSIMVGGDADAVHLTMPLFSAMGKNIRHMGGAGAGQHTKMVNQILISTNMIGVVEGLLYAKKAGLDLDEAIRAVSAGAAGSWSISNMGPRIAKRNFDPGFFVEHFLKDMGIALKEAQRCVCEWVGRVFYWWGLSGWRAFVVQDEPLAPGSRARESVVCRSEGTRVGRVEWLEGDTRG